jgi:SpoVK/Ycf46/Vps4 family AAA+-type ATPase
MSSVSCAPTKSLPVPGQFIGNLALVLSFSNVIQQWQMLLNLAGNGSSTLSSSNMMDGIGGNILLYGPHGNGKSLLIQTLVIDPQSRPKSSNTAYSPSIGRQIDPIKTNIIHLNPSDVYSKYLGESEKKIRQTFAIARQLAPSIVIIDNIDSIASNRENGQSDSTNTGGVDLRILSTLLNELDGLDTSSVHHTKKQVMVIATCSSLNSIDPALLRSGRFDHVLHVSTPNTHDITQILSNELGSILSNSQIDVSLAHISLISRHIEKYNLSTGSIIQLVRQAIRQIILPR